MGSIISDLLILLSLQEALLVPKPSLWFRDRVGAAFFCSHCCSHCSLVPRTMLGKEPEPTALGEARRVTWLLVSDSALPDIVTKKESSKRYGKTGKICGAGGHLSVESLEQFVYGQKI